MRRLTAALLAAALPTLAASPQAWELSSYDDFLKGTPVGLSIGRQGRLRLAPKPVEVFASAQGAIWAMARAADGTIYLATGHSGKLFRIPPGGKGEVIFTAPEPEIFALALDAQGRIYAATSPDGKIYRIENGHASEYFRPWTRYIWSLAAAPDGTLYAGTGDQGRIYRITGPGQGELFFDTEQMHVTALALDSKGRLLAGTEPNGMLYRVDAKDKAFALYDSSLPEIRAILPAPDGSLYVAALGGSLVKQGIGAGATPQVTSSLQTSAPTATMTVTDEGVQRGQPPQPKPPTAQQPQAAQQQAETAAAQAMVEYPGVEKAALYRIGADNTAETLWSSKEENLYDVALNGNRVFLATDNNARLYELGRDRKTRLLAETREGEALRLLADGAGVLVATSPAARLVRYTEPATEGEFESPIHDATTVARWGRVSWSAESCASCKIALRVRTGNSARPDRTWSDWSEPLTAAEGSAIPNPNARYVQWKATLTGAAGKSPVLDSVRVAYLPQNTPPEVKALTVSSLTSAAAVSAIKPNAAAQPAYSITVTDSGEEGASSSSGTPTQPVTRSATEQIQIAWSGEDLDGDKLAYKIEFRSEGQSGWTFLKGNLTETTYAVDAESFADGRYQFRVTASDAASNSAASAREADIESAQILIDRTPPLVTMSAPKRSGAGNQTVDVQIETRDGASPLTRCEYSLNAGPWRSIDADDGVIDSPTEKFNLRLANLPAGEYLLVVRAYDSANNAGVARTVLK
ncbi:MAG: WD40 repeat domain-containing protein [Acidobacteriota bacterium]